MIPDIAPPGSSPPLLSAAVKSLLRHFHRQSPIRGGSLLITIFGDSIAPRGGAITLGSLISLARPFQLTERLVRTSVARLASDGWLIARRDGRRSEYRLSPTGLERFAEATHRIYGEIPSSWDGQWTLLMLPPAGTGSRRQDVRDELRWLGFGQVNPGLFAHPNLSVRQARAALNGLDAVENALLLKSESEGSQADRRLVASGWDLGDLTRRYRRFVDTFTPVLEAATSKSSATLTTADPDQPPAAGHHSRAAAASEMGTASGMGTASEMGTASGMGATSGMAAASGTDASSHEPNSTSNTWSSADAPHGPNLPVCLNDGATSPGDQRPDCLVRPLPAEAAFVIRTLLIHEYRKIHLQDPLLPPALLPSDWVGAAAYDLSKRLYSAVFAAAERYLSDTASTMTEPLPPADSSAYTRFGGLQPD